ncbi:integrase, partial [Enterococcus faecium]
LMVYYVKMVYQSKWTSTKLMNLLSNLLHRKEIISLENH